MKKSDTDIMHFLDSLESRGDSSIVLFFGDHAPALGAEFYDNLPATSELNKYASPYFIYNTKIYDYSLNIVPEEQISTNYLGYHFCTC
jgi:phosphoglycerol transferase MdoB-like AlkP superfamily enzyme